MTHRPGFCGVLWDSHGSSHSCLKRQGHEPPHWCCNDSDYPGGVDWTGPIFTTIEELLAARDAASEQTP